MGEDRGEVDEGPRADSLSDVQVRLALLAFDVLPNTSVSAFDTDFRYVLSRGQAMEQSGVSPAEVEGRTASEVLVPERWALYEPYYRAALEGRSGTLEVVSPDGERIYVVHIGPLGTDPVVGGLAVATDITTLRRAQRSEQQLAAIVHHSDDAIISVDLEGNVTTWNAGAQRLLGYSAEEVIGSPLLVWLPDDRADEAAHIWRGMSGGDPVRVGDTQRLHKDGHPVDVSITLSPILDGEGSMTGFSAVVRSIADRVHAEKERAEAEHSRDQLFSLVSHELRTPLHGILSSADLLTLDRLTDEQQAGVDHIRAAARVLADLIDELLDISRSEADALVMTAEPVHADEVIDVVAGITSATALERKVRLVVGPADAPPLLGNRQRLEQVLLNLVSNAIKFTEDGGTVTVSSAAAPDGRVRIEVTNTGPGIPPAMLEQVFKPFERLDAEARGIAGSGLGLTFTKSMVEAMGGTVTVTSEVGRDTTFTVTLPAAAA